MQTANFNLQSDTQSLGLKDSINLQFVNTNFLLYYGYTECNIILNIAQEIIRDFFFSPLLGNTVKTAHEINFHTKHGSSSE